jgi:hypothetical protein
MPKKKRKVKVAPVRRRRRLISMQFIPRTYRFELEPDWFDLKLENGAGYLRKEQNN